jgi:hypothetical protein
VLANGVVIERHEGTPQGGPLSPLLANVLLDEVDKELERRGHAFVRYADDLNVYMRSERAGERMMTSLRKLFAKLKLRINQTKSKVTRATNAKFLQTAGSSQTCRLTSTRRTARCGPACRVVWHGTRRPNRRAPMPIAYMGSGCGAFWSAGNAGHWHLQPLSTGSKNCAISMR